MKLTLQRFSGGDTSTLGLFHIDDAWQCFTLEDEHRDVKVPGETRIPAGVYGMALRTEGGLHQKYLNRFQDMHKGMLWLRHVPQFDWIYLHCGNYEYQTDGCPLVGDGALQNVTGAGAVQKSTAAYRRIYPPIAETILAGEDVVIEVIDP